MGKKIDMTGWKMWEHGVPNSLLTVLKEDIDYKKEHNISKTNTDTYWQCLCKCGNIKTISSKRIRKGLTLSCGCLSGKKSAKDYTNKKVGKLTFIKPTEQRNGTYVIWECLCDCGNTCYISTKHIKDGLVKSCGCLKKENGFNKYKNLLNQKFGKLLVIEKSPNIGKFGNALWICQCDCGNICEKDAMNLQTGRIVSCGCLSKSKGADKIIEILKENNINFEIEKRFKTCRSPKNYIMPFDFYINNDFLLEFDGQQHYNYKNNGWNNKENYETTILHDKLKNKWCKKNNIILKRIPYWEYDNITIENIMGDKFIYKGDDS